MRIWSLYAAATALTLGVLGGMELAARHEPQPSLMVPGTGFDGTLRRVATTPLVQREIGNQMLAHNIALLARYPHPETVTTAFMGTSRSKVLRPTRFGVPGAVNASGNSYNEISYGLLLQAEVLRHQFPGLKRVFVESSMLLRRPAVPHFFVEPDHRKYLPLLETLAPIRDKLQGGEEFRRFIRTEEQNQATGAKPIANLQLALYEHRKDFRLLQLLRHMVPLAAAEPNAPQDAAAILPIKDAWLKQLAPNGERNQLSRARILKGEQATEIKPDHIKVRRLEHIPEWMPWDGQFDMFALWGREHHIEVIFYEPPVRSDLQKHQRQYGLDLHQRDMLRVAKAYGVPYVNLNTAEAGFSQEWGLFSDEDHMETCVGAYYLQKAIEMGYKAWRHTGVIAPTVSLHELKSDFGDMPDICQAA